jgi:HNH endonuclease
MSPVIYIWNEGDGVDRMSGTINEELEENVRRDNCRSAGATCRDAGRFAAAVPEAERFWSKVELGPCCWLWLGRPNRFGYGRFTRSDRVVVLAHRFAYELFEGPIPEGLTLDHLCETPACVRPEHLEPVTNAENVRRRWERQRHRNGEAA